MPNKSPTIRLFTKTNGESVAFAIHGQGPMLVVPAWWVSHLELDWNLIPYQRFFLQLGQYFTVVRYDRPGSGLSDRVRHQFTLNDEVSTLNQLIDHLSIDSCRLLGISCGGPPALVYAQMHPEKVTQVALIDSYTNGAELGNETIQSALCSLVSAHWGMGAKAILDLFDPDMAQDRRKELSAVHNQSTSAGMAKALLMLSFQMDATAAASQLAVPALVIHRSKDRTVPFESGRKLAALLPNAQLVSVEGKAHLPWLGENADLIVQEIVRFSGLGFVVETHSAPVPETTEPNQFLKMGDVWTLSFSGTTVHVKEAKGLNDIAYLIKNRGSDIHVLDLMRSGEPLPLESQSEALDQQAISEYKQRLQALIEDKKSAALCADEIRYAELEKEEDALIAALKQGIGLGGRKREFNHSAEKARKAVTARIKTALKSIAAANPLLGEHLQASLVTGTFCYYSPESSIRWLT